MEHATGQITDIEVMLEQANEQVRLGQVEAADRLFQELLAKDPNHHGVLHAYGLLFYSQGRVEEAIPWVERAIALNSKDAAYFSNLGFMVLQLGRLGPAIEYCKQAVTLNPNFLGAWNNLGLAYHENKQADWAIPCFQKALALEPNYAISHHNLSRALRDRRDFETAFAHAKEALRLQPDHVEAQCNLGGILMDLGQWQQAITVLADILNREPGLLKVYHTLISLHLRQFEPEQALQYCQRALEIAPDSAESHHFMGVILRDVGEAEQADQWYDKALQLGAGDAVRIKKAVLLPAIYSSQDHIDQWRARYEANIAALGEQRFEFPDILQTMGFTPSFYLAYQNGNDQPIQKQLGKLYRQFVPTIAPPLKPNRKPRIGFISRFMTSTHTIGKLMLGLINELSRDKFDVLVFKIDAEEPLAVTAPLTYVTLPYNLALAQRHIADQNLDVLFYADIGMDPLSHYLAFSRLARIQMVTWGHPVTTGISTIDYFLSSELVEPEHAQDHYTETLIQLKSLPTYYFPTPPPLLGKKRSDYGLPETGHFYFCPQSSFKLHPAFDAALAGILREDPQGFVVLIEGHYRNWSNQLRQRFAQTMPDVTDRIFFLSRIPSDHFVQLIALCDVMLDTFYFGGGNTTFEALSLAVPIVTMPGPYMRGRVTYGCYRKMGIMECVASTPEQYIDIAVRLGTDAGYRQTLRDQIRDAQARLFLDRTVIDELEQFLMDALAQSQPLSLAGQPIQTHTATCPACGYHLAVDFFDGREQPLATLAWPESTQEAEAMKRLPLTFVACVDCGHVFNPAFRYEEVPYSNKPNLMYNQAPIWSEHLQAIQQRLLSLLPENPTVVEIGCGNGHFIHALAEHNPKGRFYGFDPNTSRAVEDGLVTFRRELFVPDQHIAELKPDLIISRHVLEHLVNPLGFVQSLAFAASWQGLDVRLFIEVPCIDRVLETARTVDFYYEHNSHFTTHSFTQMLNRSTSKIDWLDYGYNSEVIYALVSLGKQDSQNHFASQALHYYNRVKQAESTIGKQLDELVKAGKRVAVWGGTGKSAAFICHYQLDKDRFPLVVDSDADKLGTFVPGTGQEIVSPECLLTEPVEVIVIPPQWRAADIVLEIQQRQIPYQAVLIEHHGRLTDYHREEHPYR